MPADYLAMIRAAKPLAQEQMSGDVAIDILSRHGVRRLQVDNVFTIAMWRSQIRNSQVRAAVTALYGDHVQVLDLVDSRIPDRFRLHRVVSQADQIDEEKMIDWDEWKAVKLNQLFRKQGQRGEPGKITAETIRHAERAEKAK